MRWILAKALDHACVPSQLSPFIISPLSHPSLPSSRQLFSVFDSVSAFCFRHSSISAFSLSLPCFQFIALASTILPRSRSCRLRFLSFVYSPFHLVSLTRHLYNMSPIVTFLVSGLLSLFRRCVAFILGFLAMSPVPFMASYVPAGVPPCGFEDPRKTSLPSRRTSWLLPPFLGLKIPAKLHFLFLIFVSASHFVSAPIVFVDLSSSLFFRLVHRYSRYPFFVVSFGFSSLCRFLVVFSSSFLSSFSATYPTSFRLFLRCFRYPLSRICFLFRFRFSFVFYYPSWLPSVSASISSLFALSIPVLSSIVSSLFSSCLSSFVSSSFRLPLSIVLASVFPSVIVLVSRLFPPYSRPVFRLSLPLYSPWDTRFSSLVSRFPCFRMVQPTSAILIFGLGFRFYSRQSIISAQPVLHVFSFVPTHHVSSASSILPSTLFVASTSFLDCSGFSPPFSLFF
jgi:hypothetical protein